MVQDESMQICRVSSVAAISKGAMGCMESHTITSQQDTRPDRHSLVLLAESKALDHRGSVRQENSSISRLAILDGREYEKLKNQRSRRRCIQFKKYIISIPRHRDDVIPLPSMDVPLYYTRNDYYLCN